MATRRSAKGHRAGASAFTQRAVPVGSAVTNGDGQRARDDAGTGGGAGGGRRRGRREKDRNVAKKERTSYLA